MFLFVIRCGGLCADLNIVGSRLPDTAESWPLPSCISFKSIVICSLTFHQLKSSESDGSFIMAMSV